MAETSEDLRAFSIVLVSARLLQPHDERTRALALSILRWGDAAGHGIYQLPRTRSATKLAPDAPGTSSSALDFVSSQLDVYTSAGYSIVGALLSRYDLASRSGQQMAEFLAARQPAPDFTWWTVPARAVRFDPVSHRTSTAPGHALDCPLLTAPATGPRP